MMPQQSYGFATGRVQVLSQTLLHHAALERLLPAQSVEEVARALTELNWGDVRTKGDIERVAERHAREAAELVKACSPDEAATDCFLIKYDVLNLKLLLKARVLGQITEELPLSQAGLIEPARLRRAVEESRYIDLPAPLKAAMEQIEKRIAVKMDPLYVDVALDKAMSEFIGARLPGSSDRVVKAYFATQSSMVNLMIALRAHGMGGSALAGSMYLPGGDLAADALNKIADEPERAWFFVADKPYADALSAALKRSPISLPEVEKAVDDFLFAQITPHRNDVGSVLPLVWYLLAREREAGAVRLIATAKAAHVDNEQVLMRLRVLN